MLKANKEKYVIEGVFNTRPKIMDYIDFDFYETINYYEDGY